MLRYISDGEAIPTELVEKFLAIPRIAAIFTRPYFDWHHVWYYIFQQSRSTHPFMIELGRQARLGPDLSMLARWYPPSYESMPVAYRDQVLEGIRRYVEPMTADEVSALETLEVPPLIAPQCGDARGPGRVTPAEPEGVGEASQAICEMLRRLLTIGPLPELGGARVVEVVPHMRQIGALVVVKSGAGDLDEDRLVVLVSRVTSSTESHYFKLGSIGVSYQGADALTVPWKRQALNAIVQRLVTAAKSAKRG